MIGHSGEHLGYSGVCIDYRESGELGLDYSGVCLRVLKARGTYYTILIGHSGEHLGHSALGFVLVSEDLWG